MTIAIDGVVLKDVTIVSMRLERLLPDGAPHQGTRRGVVVLGKKQGVEFEIDMTEAEWEALVDWVATYEGDGHVE